MPLRDEKPSVELTIKQCALELGFDLVGITTAERFERDERVAAERVRLGLMDGLAWYTEERVARMNRPRELMPEARSVISMAVSYSSETASRAQDSQNRTYADHDDPAASGVGPAGRIARYARGDDYHAVIKKRLKSFADRLPSVVGRPVRTRVFVDDGPMNDRAAAERAGVGWFGKSTNILTPTHGSWVFLCQVITDIDLQPDSALKKTCGTCVRCIIDCPTGAIVAPYTVDNGKCISYLTIELRGPIPRELRAMIGSWVFGCDVCQDVCPVNRKARLGRQPEFAWRSGFAAPELTPLLELDDESFREKFRNSPVKRAKRTGLQRNVCVALGNIGDPAAAPALIATLEGAEPLVKRHAAWALGRIGGEDAARALRDALDGERDAEVRLEVEQSLADLRDGEL
ncbi:MAG: tRNA epoxyqueuosine(34) reductase QueG [SAR202 cluster bacterium]|nr:tRNA epoxyqueuosine(34) reductase QueG [Chloroflexota bacterium]MQG56308.1 tRNA epoxyqueuosine(34) reductase QueG [SAR202 cluster bacterium]MQG69171.1 tRNA epoxyqueuosine(34) reductase QueG [SAR202 cluster bacterium]